MKRDRYVDPANADLVARLASLGQDVSARRIERWAEEGLLPPAEGRGSDRSYPRGTDEVAVQIAELQDEGLTFCEISAVLFLRGHGLSIDTLRNAYAVAFTRMVDVAGRFAAGEDSFETAERLGRRLASRASRTEEGRRWKDRLSGRDESARSIFESINIVLIHTVLEGAFPYTGHVRNEALQELVDGSGLRSFETDRVGEIGPVTESLAVHELGEVLDLFNVDVLTEILATSSLDDLLRARTLLRRIASFNSVMAEFIRRVGGSHDAMGFGILDLGRDELLAALLIPWFRVLEVQFPELVDHERAEHLDDMTATMGARLAMLDAIPSRFWPLAVADEESVRALPESDADELRDALERFAQEDPDSFALSLSVDEDDDEPEGGHRDR